MFSSMNPVHMLQHNLVLMYLICRYQSSIMNTCSVCRKAGKKKKIDETTGLLVCRDCRMHEGWDRRHKKDREQKVE